MAPGGGGISFELYFLTWKYYVNGIFSPELVAKTLLNFAYAIIPFIIVQTNYFSLTYDFIL